MEADEVYSSLNDKISELNDKIGDVRDSVESVKSSIESNSSNSKFDDLKSSIDRLQSDLKDLADRVGSMKSSSDSSSGSTAQGILDQMKRIEEANAASEKKFQEQQGFFNKLSSQAEEAARMIGSWPDTMSKMATNAVEASKKDILGIWESSKNDIMNSISGVATGLIDKAKGAIKDEIKDDLRSMILDDVKTATDEAKDKAPPPMSADDIEALVRKILKEGKDG